MTDPRLNVQSGPFKGKPQQWFTRAEVERLLAAQDWTDDAMCLSGLADRLEEESAVESDRGNDSAAAAWSCRAYELRQIVSRMVRTVVESWRIERTYNRRSGATAWTVKRGDEFLRMAGKFTTIRRFRTEAGAQRAADKANATPGVEADRGGQP